ncbi:MAG: histidine phosphatase family protein [Firmicutes bacterium]|nr:histidine phosphatase family protein [Bacillota bacterium]
MKKLYIVRHGQTDWNVQKLLQGKTDIELNEEGIKQAKELAKVIDLDKIDICICSPLKRTRKTAELIVGDKVPIVYDELVLERDFGNYEGNPIIFDLIAKQWDYKINDREEGIEPVQDCLKRAKKFLNKINNEYKNKNILIVSHGSFIKALHFNLIGYNENTDLLSFNPKNALIYEYEIE